MAINREWHEKHRMPKNATEMERMLWHKEHAKNCNCRPIPEASSTMRVKAQIKKQQAYNGSHVN